VWSRNIKNGCSIYIYIYIYIYDISRLRVKRSMIRVFLFNDDISCNVYVASVMNERIWSIVGTPVAKKSTVLEGKSVTVRSKAREFSDSNDLKKFDYHVAHWMQKWHNPNIARSKLILRLGRKV